MIKDLTKTIKNLINKAESLPARQNYYSGLLLKDSNTTGLPDSILIFKRKGVWPTSREGKIHSRYLLSFNLGIESISFLDGKKYLLLPGQSVLVHPYKNHSFIHDSQNVYRLMIGFKAAKADFIPDKNYFSFTTPVVFKYLEYLLEEYLNRANPMACSLLLSMILNELKQQTAPAAVLPLNCKLQWLEDIFLYIQKNIHKAFTIEQLAKHFNVSASNLRLQFRKKTGMSLGSYIINSRINRAVRQLSESNMDISEIAENCGYDSLQSFSRAFSREIKMSPLAYRKLHKK